MLSELREIGSRLGVMGRGFDPALVAGDDASALVEAATVVERAAGSIRARAAARAAEAQAWRREGFRSPEEWLARRAGSSKAEAKKTLRLGEQLERHDATREEYASGRLSEDQAVVVAGAADENPGAEAGLLATAAGEALTTLRREAARAKAAVGDEEARQARIHDERYASCGPDDDGALRGSWRMAAFQGGVFETVFGQFRSVVARDAKRQGRRLTAGQIGADALVLMAQTAAERRAGGGGGVELPDARLHLLVDQAAWERGHTEAGETCEIDGVGPVTVAQARQLVTQGAFVTASTWDGTDVCRVAHFGTCDPLTLTTAKIHEYLAATGVDVHDIETDGRHVPAVLDTAVTIRDRTCRHPGCDHRWALQRDHIHPVELGGLTSYRNLQRLCWYHHQAKTRRDMDKIRGARRIRAGPAPPG